MDTLLRESIISMSQKSKMRARARGNDSPAKAVPAGKAAPFRAGWLSGAGVMGLLVVLAFLLYWPSLKSDFVYDANYEILEEGFITSWANLPDVLSFKVLGENLILADRPGTILYLMIHARLWGKEPWGFHLGSNLLHALNAGLLFLLGWRLVEAELPGEVLRQRSRMLTALFAVTLIFAVHPIAAETVSGISYCSDLLMTFFTLIALCAATAFRADDRPTAWVMGALGTVGRLRGGGLQGIGAGRGAFARGLLGAFPPERGEAAVALLFGRGQRGDAGFSRGPAS